MEGRHTMAKQIVSYTTSTDDITGETRQNEDFPSYVLTMAPAIVLADGQDNPNNAQKKAQREATETFTVDLSPDTIDALRDLFSGDKEALYELIRPVSAGGKAKRVRNGKAKKVREWAASMVASDEFDTSEWPELTSHGRIPDVVLAAFEKAHPATPQANSDNGGEDGETS